MFVEEIYKTRFKAGLLFDFLLNLRYYKFKGFLNLKEA